MVVNCNMASPVKETMQCSMEDWIDHLYMHLTRKKGGLDRPLDANQRLQLATAHSPRLLAQPVREIKVLQREVT